MEGGGGGSVCAGGACEWGGMGMGGVPLESQPRALKNGGIEVLWEARIGGTRGGTQCSLQETAREYFRYSICINSMEACSLLFIHSLRSDLLWEGLGSYSWGKLSPLWGGGSSGGRRGEGDRHPNPLARTLGS